MNHPIFRSLLKLCSASAALALFFGPPNVHAWDVLETDSSQNAQEKEAEREAAERLLLELQRSGGVAQEMAGGMGVCPN